MEMFYVFIGTGAQATPESTVTVHYHGTLTDGSTFDSSVDRGEPIKFPLTNVIKGWQEGVSMMREGGRAKLVIPSELVRTVV
jgi:FKBP-type peptidyl-prolyl cis-trans isomerase